MALEEVKKDPEIKNTGKNRAIVFMQVDIPMEKMITATEDGTRNTLSNTEVFDFRTEEGTYDSVHGRWKLIDQTYLDSDMNVLDSDSLTHNIVKLNKPKTGKTGSTVYTVTTDADRENVPVVTASGDVSESAAYCRRLYGYDKVLDENRTTDSLFDVVRTANFIEDNIDNTFQNIVITSYGVQAENIHNLTDATFDETMDEQQLKDIFRVYVKQSGSVVSDDADTSNGQTLKKSTLNITMSVDSTHLKLNSGNVDDAKAKATVKVAYTGGGTKPGYSFTSSDESVATIDADGNITAHGVGKTVITATAINPDNNKASSATVVINVRDVNEGN